MAVEDTALRRKLDDVGPTLTSGDADRTGNLYTRAGQLLPPGSEIVAGRDAVAEFWRRTLEAGVETIDIDTLEVETHENSAFRVGLATLLDGDDEPIDEVKFIEVWKREGEEWRIHRDIWNSNIAEE